MAKKYREYIPEKGLRGPFPLDEDEILTFTGDCYGVYLLIFTNPDGTQLVVYVGRGDIPARLTEHLEQKDADSFYFKFLDDDDEGFAEECRLFHDYGKRKNLDNERHPAVPAGSPRNYPRCSQRGCNGEAD